MVEKAADNGRVPVVLGGDHSVAIGTVSGMSRHFRKAQLKLGLIWIDAHADMNTPASSPSGNVHGMPLACCIGQGPRELTHIGGPAPQVEPTSVALIGLRSVDDVERFNVRGAGVHPFTMRDIDERGLPAVIREAIEVVSAGTAGFHLSFDMDAVDPREAPGVGTPVPAVSLTKAPVDGTGSIAPAEPRNGEVNQCWMKPTALFAAVFATSAWERILKLGAGRGGAAA
jgi:arginase